jgi:large subunit ribosomal protein L21
MAEMEKTAEKKVKVEKTEDKSIFAVIESGAKQYLVRKGQKIEVEKLEVEEGKEIALDALLVGSDKEVKVGKPIVSGAKVKAKVLGQNKGDKLIVFKYKPKKNQRTKTGHRQKYTELEITKIEM